jgi:hypothetical protein
MPNPSAATLRSPRAPYGGRLLGTDGMQGANTQHYGNEGMAGAIGDNLMGLLGGKNTAADQADRTNLTAMSQLQKNQNAGTQRNAAQLGIQPGDPRYSAYQAKNNNDLQSMGSKLMGDSQQKRLDDQSRNLTTAVAFNQGQQNFGESARRYDQDFGEDTRRYDQDFASNEKTKEVSTLFDIINNPLSSEGQVEAAKQRLLQTQSGLDAGMFNTAEKNNSQRQFDEIKNQLAVMNPGMNPEQLDAMARERFAEMDKAAYNSLVKANGTDEPGKGGGGGGDWTTSGLADVGNLALMGSPLTGGLGPISAGKAVGHTGGEVYRGVRDIGRGDVIGGTGRVFAAPVRGVAHGVADNYRSAKRTLGRIFG